MDSRVATVRAMAEHVNVAMQEGMSQVLLPTQSGAVKPAHHVSPGKAWGASPSGSPRAAAALFETREQNTFREPSMSFQVWP